jgi:hypothetical protein
MCLKLAGSPDGPPCHLDPHLQVAGHDQSGFDLLAIPTQRRAFELLSAPIPLTLK